MSKITKINKDRRRHRLYSKREKKREIISKAIGLFLCTKHFMGSLFAGVCKERLLESHKWTDTSVDGNA